MIDLALASRIAPQAWLAAGGRAIATAEELLDEAYRGRQTGPAGPQMSG